MPPHIAIVLLGSAMGIDWDKVRERTTLATHPEKMPELTPTTGISVTELAKKMTPPKDIGASLAASSWQALRLVKQPQASNDVQSLAG